MVEIGFKKVHAKARLPEKAHASDAGFDVYSVEDVALKPFTPTLVKTGLVPNIPDGYEIQVRPRSGLATKHGVTVINSPGTVDADYRGELKVSLVNLSSEPFEIVPGERIAQMVVAAHETVEWENVEALSETERGAGGWGSTGAK